MCSSRYTALDEPVVLEERLHADAMRAARRPQCASGALWRSAPAAFQCQCRSALCAAARLDLGGVHRRILHAVQMPVAHDVRFGGSPLHLGAGDQPKQLLTEAPECKRTNVFGCDRRKARCSCATLMTHAAPMVIRRHLLRRTLYLTRHCDEPPDARLSAGRNVSARRLVVFTETSLTISRIRRRESRRPSQASKFRCCAHFPPSGDSFRYWFLEACVAVALPAVAARVLDYISLAVAPRHPRPPLVQGPPTLICVTVMAW